MNPNTHHEHEEYITTCGRDFRCLFRREVDSGYQVTCADLPPMLAFGDTLDEARENALQELEAWIEEHERIRDFAERPYWRDRGSE